MSLGRCIRRYICVFSRVRAERRTKIDDNTNEATEPSLIEGVRRCPTVSSFIDDTLKLDLLKKSGDALKTWEAFHALWLSSSFEGGGVSESTSKNVLTIPDALKEIICTQNKGPEARETRLKLGLALPSGCSNF